MTRVVRLSDEPQRMWPWVMGIWTAVAVVYAIILSQQEGIWLGYTMISSSINYYTLAILAIPLSSFSRRMAETAPSKFRQIASHCIAGAAVVGVWQSVYLGYLRIVVGSGFWTHLMTYWMYQLFGALVTYGATLAIILALQANARSREKERLQSEMEILARDAELSALKAKLQPHFLFNTLHSILSLIDCNPAQARVMVERLAELLQSVFDEFDESHVPVDREVAMLEAYLAIERIRFGDRLYAHVDVDPRARGYSIPGFLLQPLVENAIKHGIEPNAGPGEVQVSVGVEGGTMRVDVIDTGAGIDLPRDLKSGRALDVTQRRLDGLYGKNYRLDFEREAGRFAVRLRLPLSAHAA